MASEAGAGGFTHRQTHGAIEFGLLALKGDAEKILSALVDADGRSDRCRCRVGLGRFLWGAKDDVFTPDSYIGSFFGFRRNPLGNPCVRVGSCAAWRFELRGVDEKGRLLVAHLGRDVWDDDLGVLLLGLCPRSHGAHARGRAALNSSILRVRDSPRGLVAVAHPFRLFQRTSTPGDSTSAAL